MTLPAKDGRKGKVLAFDSTTGNPVAGPSLDSMVTVIEQSAFINAVGENIDDVIAVADNEANIDTVAGVSSSVTTVATNISNVNTVADDLNEDVSEIHTVGTNIANVNTVGTNIANVNTVAGISANVTTVAGISSNVTTVAGISSAVTGVNAISSAVTGVDANATDISAVNANKTNIDTVAGIAANVTTVAGISANVTSVAGNSTNINTVATDIANVNSVGGNIANVNSVAGNATNINAVNANATNINTVAGINANVTTVAGISANVTTVAGISGNVTSVAGNASNINQVASDTVAINSASANATSAAASALSASNSATSASASAAAASAVALGNEPVRHSVRPSLLLDFANTKTLDPRITFTRASTGTYYDGKTVAKAEENLITYSQEFDNAYWGKLNATVTANTVAAPDGTTTAEAIFETATTGNHRVDSGNIAFSALPYVFSVYVKPNGRDWVVVQCGAGGSRAAWFNVTTGVVGTVQGSVTSTSITSVGNGWYRCSVVATSTAATTPCIVYVADADGSVSYAGDITKGLYLWGAQLEQRSSVTAYTATTTAPITNYIPALQSAASGVARFEHNPVTGESLGLEIEEQRTNLLTYSEQFDNAIWTKTNSSITANTVVAPDGNLTGDKLVEDATSNWHQTTQVGISFVSGTAYTISVIAKQAERSVLQIVPSAAAFPVAFSNFNLATGALGSSSGITSNSITDVGNGWYRCSITLSANATASSGITLSVQNSASALRAGGYTGDGYSGIFIWGAQLEAGSFATSYIPTVASQVTRSPDAASMTGSNFSSWYRADEGTIYAETISPNSFSRCQASINDGTNNNKIEPALSSGNTYLLGVNVGGTAVGSAATANTATANTASKTAGAYRVNDFAVSLNAGTVATDTSGAIPIVDRMFIGQRTAGSVSLNGTISKIAYYGRRLSNAELQGLTTI
jgi:hypothetical protein